MDVATLGSEPVGYSANDLRRYRKSREVGASVRTCDLPVLWQSGAAACRSESALPVESVHPHCDCRPMHLFRQSNYSTIADVAQLDDLRVGKAMALQFQTNFFKKQNTTRNFRAAFRAARGGRKSVIENSVG